MKKTKIQKIINRMSVLKRYFVTLALLNFLLAVVYLYYFRPVTGLFESTFFVVFLFASVTDGLFLLLHLFRQPGNHKRLSFSPKDLTVVITCHNSEDIMRKTIKGVLKHVGAKQIIVVSDASSDNTVQIAKSMGVNVIDNKVNLGKAFSVSKAAKSVNTRYTLLMDDDVMVADTFIPTSLLDDGYDAVAFNIMPMAENTLINKIQRFEYRKSMYLGKNVRAVEGTVSNVSGAIGLYRTQDLVEQIGLHSGQFGGEDLQRTFLVHMHGKGKGITYTDSVVLTEVPQTLKQLYKQRAYSWNVSWPEMFFIYLEILINSKHKFMLKADVAYQTCLFLTDPIKMMFFWVLFVYPISGFALYIYYLLLTMLVWLKLGRRDSFMVVLIFPLYSVFDGVCRFIAQVYWFKIKYKFFVKRLHRMVEKRRLGYEFAAVSFTVVSLWTLSTSRLDYFVQEDPQTIQVLGQTFPGIFNFEKEAEQKGSPTPPQLIDTLKPLNYIFVVEPGEDRLI